MILDKDDKITLGQCYNLAHAQTLKECGEDGLPTKKFEESIMNTTIQLFHLKHQIEKKLVENPVTIAKTAVESLD